jgi:subtilisin family serine protease
MAFPALPALRSRAQLRADRVIRCPLVALALLGCIAVPTASAAAARAPATASAAAHDELIVRFSARADGAQRAQLRDSVDADAVRGLPLPGGQLLRLEGDVGAKAAIARLERSRDVLYAEPNVVRTSSATMNDLYFGQLWGLRNTGQTVQGTSGTAGDDIAALSAWDLTTGSPSAPVAVIDSGVAANHPDLSAQIATNSDEIAANGLDDDANGYVDDVAGWDFVFGDANPNDANGHGTHVAGTIAARGNDGTGVVGVAPTTRIMPLRVLDANGSGTVADVLSAYGYAVREGARIVNLSLGGDSPSQSERDAIAAAPGVLFVAAAGNGGSDGQDGARAVGVQYPCSYDLANVVCVAASDSHDQLASFSNYGATSVDLAAPGVNILSDRPPSGGVPQYGYSDGTSMATPHVSGAAALAMALSPGASVAAVKQALLNGTDARPTLTNKTVSGGRLDARGTLELLSGAPPIPPPAPPPAWTPSRPAPTRTAAPSPVVRDTAPPLASLLLGTRQGVSIMRRRGLRPRVKCLEACTANAVLTLSPANAKRIRLGSGARTVRIGRASKRLPSAASTRLTVRLTSTAGRALGRLTRSVRATLTVAFVDAAGNQRTLRKAITLVAAAARRR